MAERPRCGKPVRRDDRNGPFQPWNPVCGMPEGHHGHCLSEAAWKRKLAANARYVQAVRERARRGGRRAA